MKHMLSAASASLQIALGFCSFLFEFYRSHKALYLYINDYEFFFYYLFVQTKSRHKMEN